MKYVTNLIPHEYKVLPNYFKGSVYEHKKSSTLLKILGWIGGIICILFSLATILHPFLFVVFVLLSLILLPPGHRWLEKVFRFQLTSKIKGITLLLLFIISLPLVAHYGRIDNELLQKRKIEKETREHEIAESLSKENKRIVQFGLYLEKSKLLTDSGKTDKAMQQLDSAVFIAVTDNEKYQITAQRTSIASGKTFALVNAGKYKVALPSLDSLIEIDSGNDKLHYHRALCYSKIGRIEDAVKECRTAIALGNPDAQKLHDKINPVKKRVAYYVTRCCDGSTSNATGRGACSHHGGVCNWHEPVYEEYRKY